MRRIDENRDFLTREPPELHALACFVHGALTTLHLLGAVYNFRRRNWFDVAAHVAAAVYDAKSARHHYRTEQVALRRGSFVARPGNAAVAVVASEAIDEEPLRQRA